MPITEGKLTEVQINESRDTLFTVLESLNAIVCAVGIENHEILYTNRYAREISGDMVGKDCCRGLSVKCHGPCSFSNNGHPQVSVTASAKTLSMGVAVGFTIRPFSGLTTAWRACGLPRT